MIEDSIDLLELFEEFGKNIATSAEKNSSSAEKQIEQVSQRLCHFPYQKCRDKHICCLSFIFYFALNKYELFYLKILILLLFDCSSIQNLRYYEFFE